MHCTMQGLEAEMETIKVGWVGHPPLRCTIGHRPLHCIALHCITSHIITLHQIVRHSMYYIVLHYIALYCLVLGHPPQRLPTQANY